MKSQRKSSSLKRTKSIRAKPARTSRPARDYYRAVFDSAPDAVLVFQASGKKIGQIVAANPRAAELFGYSTKKLCQMTAPQLDGTMDIPSTGSIVARALKSKTFDAEMMLRRKGNSLFPARIHATLFESKGKRWVIAFESDLSDSHKSDGQLRLYEVELEKLEQTDALTETLNRKRLVELASAEFERFKRYGRRFSLIVVDVDDFRGINERYGNDMGDVTVRFLALQIASQMRRNDLIGRIGGDEFVILLPETDGQVAEMIGERIRKACHEMTVQTPKGNIKITASLGVTRVLDEDTAFDAVMQRAEEAAQRAKQKGRNRVETI